MCKLCAAVDLHMSITFSTSKSLKWISKYQMSRPTCLLINQALLQFCSIFILCSMFEEISSSILRPCCVEFSIFSSNMKKKKSYFPQHKNMHAESVAEFSFDNRNAIFLCDCIVVSFFLFVVVRSVKNMLPLRIYTVCQPKKWINKHFKFFLL